MEFLPSVWALPRSLATTWGITICFLFLGVLRCFTSPRSPPAPMYSVQDDSELPEPGCPIRKSPDQSLLSGSPKLIAASHALHRLLVPRHPLCALSSLTIFANTTQQYCSLLPVFSCQRTTRPQPEVASD